MKITDKEIHKHNGQWVLGDTHTLYYRLKSESDFEGEDNVYIAGRIKSIDAHALYLEVRHKDRHKSPDRTTVKLGGDWHVNDKNKLAFWVKKEGGAHDVLTLKNTWTIDKTHHITYRYEDAQLQTKETETQTLTLKGYWKQLENNRIYYMLESKTAKPLAFSVGWGKLDKNKISFRVDVVSDSTFEDVTLTGKWRAGEDTTLKFDVKYAQDNQHALALGIQQDVTKDISVALKSWTTGASSIKISADWEKAVLKPFLKYAKSRYEDRIEAGITFTF